MSTLTLATLARPGIERATAAVIRAPGCRRAAPPPSRA